MLTPEILMKPRWKVVADYPGSPFTVGSIVEPTNGHGFSEFSLYPAIFKEIFWWEERAVEDLPEYVKCVRTPDQKMMPGDLFKIREWFCGTCGRTTHKGDDQSLCVLDTNCFMPSTQSEYEAYKTPHP